MEMHQDSLLPNSDNHVTMEMHQRLNMSQYKDAL
jgi:hypothetical protein